MSAYFKKPIRFRGSFWIAIFIQLFGLFVLGEEFAAGQRTLPDQPSRHDKASGGSYTFRLQQTFHHAATNGSSSVQMFNMLALAPADTTLAEETEAMSPLNLRSQRTPIQQQVADPRLAHSTPSLRQSQASCWVTTEVVGPNVTDKETIINLAKMTSDAYSIGPSQPDWFNTSLGFNYSSNFGWQEDGLRGHVFADQTNKTVIIAFKGTSIDPRDKWSSNDRRNDNTLFSCCCATQRPDPYWYGSVCDCRTDTYKCNSACLTKELMREDRYYATALWVYQNVTRMYPGAQIWLTGHSMGGAMASLIGITFSVPAVTFESLPQRLPAQRLGLPMAPDPKLTGAYHFGHSADPVFMGACNGYFSSCSIGGYAFESQCFAGHRCEYDTVGDKGWRMSINTHRINNVIPNVLEAYDTVANCSLDLECAECDNWYFDWDP